MRQDKEKEGKMNGEFKILPTAILLMTTLIFGLMLLPGATSATDFEYEKTPAFKIEYPDNYVKDPLRPNEVLRAKNPVGIPAFEINVLDVPEKGPNLEGYWKNYANAMEKLGSGIKILSQEKKELDDGTAALETEFEWKFQGKTPLVSLLFITAKDNKYVSIGGHTLGNLDPIREIIESFEFE